MKSLIDPNRNRLECSSTKQWTYTRTFHHGPDSIDYVVRLALMSSWIDDYHLYVQIFTNEIDVSEAGAEPKM